MARLMSALSFLAAAAFVAALAGCTDDEERTEVMEEEVYVLNEGSGTLSILTSPGLEEHDSSMVLANPAPHHLHFDHAHVYYYIVGRTPGGFVDKYDALTNERLATSPIAHYWTGVATTEDAQHVYATDFGQDISQRTKMYIFNAFDLSVDDSITCGSQPHYIEMTEDGSTVIIVNAGSDEVTLYYPEIEDDNIVNVPIDPDPDSAAQFGQPIIEPYGLALAENDSLAYISCRKSKVPGMAMICVFDVPRRKTVDTLYVPYVKRSAGASNNRMGLCELIDNDQYLAVTSQDGNGLFLIDVSDGSYDEVLFGHDVAFGVTATSDEKYLYVTVVDPSSDQGWVYEVKRDGASLTVTDSTQVDRRPFGIHVKPGAHSHDGGH